jgi:GntP family gluconate:H+ symporter
MAVVVGGILLLRLHAFLSLVAGGLVVALLTPASAVYRYTLRANAIEFITSHEAEPTPSIKPKQKLLAGTPLLVLRLSSDGARYNTVATIQTTTDADANHSTTPRVVTGASALPMQSGDFIVDPATEAQATKASQQTIGERLADGFGRTAIEIGILIAMAAIIGKCLMESGAAERIVLSLRQLLGERRSALAFLISGFILAALVLSDTTFYLLIPLAQVMRARSGRDYTLYVLAIVAGATMTHSLVPPAPGPVFVATQLHVNLLTMIVGGVIVGGFASGSGYIYALWANRRWDIPLRAAVGASPEQLAASAFRDEATLPPLSISLAPIVVPVMLIAIAAVATNLQHKPPWVATALPVLRTLGEKNVALTIAAGIGLLMVWSRSTRGADSRRAVADALASAGVMVLIVSAGGAFGFVLRQTDIAAAVKELVPASKLALLPLAFIVTVATRTAQGSAIVSMITAVTIVGPIAADGALGFHPVYLALAIGCGSKPFMWMNDAGFWIITKISGLTETETLKTATILMAIMGCMGLLVTMIGAWLWPLV